MEMSKYPKSKKALVFLSAFCVLVLVFATAFFVYTGVYYPADTLAWEKAEEYGVRVEQKECYIAILPIEGTPKAGYVFYPGGKVEAEAYLPYLAEVAAQGYYCCLLQVPFKVAVFDMDAAAKPIQEAPAIEAWAVGGHSLGGVAAASFASKNQAVKGLVLLASYSSADISASSLQVLSITATKDEVLNWQKYEEANVKLPAVTEYVSIAGGNHGQFGMYGHQKGDGNATITPEEQQRQVAEVTVLFLGKL